MKEKLIIYPYSFKQKVKDRFSATHSSIINNVKVENNVDGIFDDREDINKMLKIIAKNPYTIRLYRDHDNMLHIIFSNEFKRRYIILYICGRKHYEIMHALGYPYLFMRNNIYGMSPIIFENEYMNSEREIWEKIRKEVSQKLIRNDENKQPNN